MGGQLLNKVLRERCTRFSYVTVVVDMNIINLVGLD